MGKYTHIAELHDGLRRVSTLRITRAQVGGSPDHTPGTWGYINAAGKEIISPQYIYATDFENGAAIVCKGKWQVRPGRVKYASPHPEEETILYGSKEELWGLIDRTGREIIPCVYAELYISDDNYIIARRGPGARNTSLVMNTAGEVLFEPEGKTLITYERNGLVTVCRGEYPEKELVGLYDLKTNKWLFDCKYEDITVNEDGTITLI